MDFWNDTTTFVKQKKWKMWTQKNAKVIFELKLKNKHYQMKNLSVKCIEIFLIYIIFKKLYDVIVVNFYPWKSFHI